MPTAYFVLDGALLHAQAAELALAMTIFQDCCRQQGYATKLIVLTKYQIKHLSKAQMDTLMDQYTQAFDAYGLSCPIYEIIYTSKNKTMVPQHLQKLLEAYRAADSSSIFFSVRDQLESALEQVLYAQLEEHYFKKILFVKRNDLFQGLNGCFRLIPQKKLKPPRRALRVDTEWQDELSSDDTDELEAASNGGRRTGMTSGQTFSSKKSFMQLMQRQPTSMTSPRLITRKKCLGPAKSGGGKKENTLETIEQAAKTPMIV